MKYKILVANYVIASANGNVFAFRGNSGALHSCQANIGENLP